MTEAGLQTAAEITRLTAELSEAEKERDFAVERLDANIAEQDEREAQWKTWGIAEIAIRNPNVHSYIEHWEGRVTKAEAQLEWHDKMFTVLTATFEHGDKKKLRAEFGEKTKKYIEAALKEHDK